MLRDAWGLRDAMGRLQRLARLGLSGRSDSVVQSCPTDAGQDLTVVLSNAESLRSPQLPSAA